MDDFAEIFGDAPDDGAEHEFKWTLPAKVRDDSKIKPEHAAWIAERYSTRDKAYCRCDSATAAMVDAFPELRRVRGYYATFTEHWWCEDAEGNIVDPTAAQFSGQGSYQELTDEEVEQHVPSGVCMDCGDPVYRGATFCSESCERATRAYLNSSRY